MAWAKARPAAPTSRLAQQQRRQRWPRRAKLLSQPHVAVTTLCSPLVQALGADPAKLNVNGGACALGHPLGGTGAKLMTTLVSEMVRTNSKLGLQAICEGGGTANATIVELC